VNRAGNSPRLTPGFTSHTRSRIDNCHEAHLSSSIRLDTRISNSWRPKHSVPRGGNGEPSSTEAVTRHFTIQGRRFATLHTSLADLIQFAHGLHSHQIKNGPKWLESDKFDVVGITGTENQPTEQEWMQMMAKPPVFQISIALSSGETRVTGLYHRAREPEAESE